MQSFKGSGGVVSTELLSWQVFQVNDVVKPTDVMLAVKHSPIVQPRDYDHNQGGTSLRSILAADKKWNARQTTASPMNLHWSFSTSENLANPVPSTHLHTLTPKLSNGFVVETAFHRQTDDNSQNLASRSTTYSFWLLPTRWQVTNFLASKLLEIRCRKQPLIEILWGLLPTQNQHMGAKTNTLT